jgi:hypothetical protein
MFMPFGFTLTKEREGPCGTAYSFRKDGEAQSELDAFWAKDDVRQAPDHDALADRLKDGQAGLLHVEWWDHHFNLRGGPWSWLRDESSSGDPTDPDYHAEALWAPIPEDLRANMPEPFPSLRLSTSSRSPTTPTPATIPPSSSSGMAA